MFTESSGNIGLIKLKETYYLYNLNNFINNKLSRMCSFVVISQNISELLYSLHETSFNNSNSKIRHNKMHCSIRDKIF